ncbi:MAG: hypothetical protein ACT4OP_01020 [Actinomycetota bacterium]
MIGVMRAEIIKMFKRRTYWVMFIVLLALTALLAGVFFVLPRVLPPGEGPPSITKPGAYLFGAQQVIDQTWFPLILAAMALAGELATSAWATTLTRNSRRWQHLVARLATTTLAAWLATLVAVGGFTLATFLWADGTGSIRVSEWVSIGWKALLIELTWVALGLGFSAWLRSVGPAVGAAIAFTFAEGILVLWGGWRTVSLSLHSSALLGPISFGGFGEVLGDTPAFSRALAIVLAWTIGATLVAWAGLQVRDA